MPSPPDSAAIAGPGMIPVPRVLAVTADIEFYAKIATSAHWRTDWARSARRAVEICTRKAVPIVIYDGNLPGVKWQWAFDCLTTAARRPRILLAADSVDESLWHDVLNRHGYDVVERSASPDHFRRVFRFASLSLAPALNLAVAGSAEGPLLPLPTIEMVDYYRQRASAGLIITEGTHPGPPGRGCRFPRRHIHTSAESADQSIWWGAP